MLLTKRTSQLRGTSYLGAPLYVASHEFERTIAKNERQFGPTQLASCRLVHFPLFFIHFYFLLLIFSKKYIKYK